ncbi:hypothetical protein CTA2_4489 [Colletotrichum tanaceti]|uniref:PKS/mFAS DH domain-containing protein n=1 Tax=Colletotrichum tanaceti TaxID=1306861 RepID=A0A4U6X8G1_9PEZI|nr:hypothetical protein CTA2_4489 [Colletotrichum tanaceti]TKW51655.1 hypothetical protein CTA1_6281 [Colletotrichum tanaceti]
MRFSQAKTLVSARCMISAAVLITTLSIIYVFRQRPQLHGAHPVINTSPVSASCTAGGHSEWREFRIQSCRDNVWATHCAGIVRPGRSSIGPALSSSEEGSSAKDTHLRVVDPEAWYRSLARSGYKYGPEFKGVEEIGASVLSPSVKLVVKDVSDAEDNKPASSFSFSSFSSYTLHPKTLDKIIQALVMAFYADLRIRT